MDKKKHFERIEKITDAILKVLDNSSIQEIQCINYSISPKQKKMCKKVTFEGPHWNITDTNYIEMLDKFLKNIYIKKETKKDIIIWCYISNLLKYIDNINPLYEYLRTIKKILNNDRAECKCAKIHWIDWGEDKKQITYARYYVKGIPNYYLEYLNYNKPLYIMESEKSNNCNNEFFYYIILLNKYGIENKNYLDKWIDNCNNEVLYNILKNEKIKREALEYEIIRNLENLPFINGLVDNFVDYKEGSCYLKEFAYNFLNILNLIENLEYQYRDILKFICSNKLEIEKCTFRDISILWEKYTGTRASNLNSTIIVHTWCDLFTNKNGIEFSENDKRHLYLYALPEGWIQNNMIIQPEDNIYIQNHKNGFSAKKNYTKKCIFSINNFISNFSWISINKERNSNKYCIDGYDKNILPNCLYNYSNQWIDRCINEHGKVYYADKQYLNEILLQILKYLNSDINTKEHIGKMICIIMYKIPFFIEFR